ncbi:MAG: hypothetical protein VX583_12725 [Bdellovibrionota bacterium]|nr:hypothetical protein [Pseudobdellovibrionaceae bacterium]|tara:strand:- start:44057 stop:44302 length:246 start_codon:yes stop_codon:yes gene_type:complete
MNILAKISSLQKSTKVLLIIGVVLAMANIVMFNTGQIDMSNVSVSEPSNLSLEDLIEQDRIYREKIRQQEEAANEAKKVSK